MPAAEQHFKNPGKNVIFKCWTGSGTFALDRFRGLSSCGSLHVVWNWVPHMECLSQKWRIAAWTPYWKNIRYTRVLCILRSAHRMPPKNIKCHHSVAVCIFWKTHDFENYNLIISYECKPYIYIYKSHEGASCPSALGVHFCVLFPFQLAICINIYLNIFNFK